jgi:hypothetical protein
MPSLLAFLSMFGEQMRVFGVRLQREEEWRKRPLRALHQQHHCICTVEYAKWVCRRVSSRIKLVGANDELREEFVG